MAPSVRPSRLDPARNSRRAIYEPFHGRERATSGSLARREWVARPAPASWLPQVPASHRTEYDLSESRVTAGARMQTIRRDQGRMSTHFCRVRPKVQVARTGLSSNPSYAGVPAPRDAGRAGYVLTDHRGQGRHVRQPDNQNLASCLSQGGDEIVE